MTARLRRRALVAAPLVMALVACEGEGSDIGPRLPRLPDASMKVLLFDDANRGVVSGTVSIASAQASALTGRNGRGDFLASPRGRLLLDVDPTWAAATDGDTLGGYRVAMSVTGTDVPANVSGWATAAVVETTGAGAGAGAPTHRTLLGVRQGGIGRIALHPSSSSRDAAARDAPTAFAVESARGAYCGKPDSSR